MQSSKWWQNAVGYQIYPRSFKDSNGDGIGDIPGIIEKLPYLKSLGIDFIWVNPIYQSPNVDNGYDISDYQAIQPEFGTLADFKALLQAAHTIGIKVILDLVVNHTSDQHPWFIESQKSKDNPYRDYYLWADATPEKMPNNWQSFFGGPTWTYDAQTKQAYFHVFAKEQPDLNWRNPEVRQAIYQMIRWWLDLGIDGFRLDAISHIQKEPWDFKIRDNPWAPFMNVAGIEVYMAELRDLFNEYQIMTVGEASGVTSKKAVSWTDPAQAGYLNMIFELEHNVRQADTAQPRLDVLGLKKVLARWQTDLGQHGWNALYVENHDNPRINSILGDETAHSAKAIALMYLGLKGTPFIYQGQELGMTNFPFTTIDQANVPETRVQYQALIDQQVAPAVALVQVTQWSRDHSRTPMQWTAAADGGFTTGQPWLPVNQNTQTINVATQLAEPQSVWHFYQQLIALRHQNAVLIDGQFEWLLKKDPNVFAYLRKGSQETMLVIANLSHQAKTITLPRRLKRWTWQYQMGNVNSCELTQHFRVAAYDAVLFSGRPR
ncbi:glycoside hydrolase family 13 protein [Latilactobacillus fuchuensis]|uniref:glycoside hydrolase family 13 protein n=1 Tax=Latilactobacillus fuchuensis TaxID=164393 RepID=UPI0039B0997D